MTISPCIALQDHNLACERFGLNRHFQLAVIYLSDVMVSANFEEGYNATAVIPNKSTQKFVRYVFQAPYDSTAIKGTYRKTENRFGFAEYEHKVNLLIHAFSEEEKRQIHALNNNVVKVVLFNSDRTAEVYGSGYGLKTTDYDYRNTPEIIELKSIKNEITMPLNYGGEMLGDEWIEDAFQIFDRTFDRTFE